MPGSKSAKCDAYNPYTTGSDIHYRTIALGVYTIFIMSSFLAMLYIQSSLAEYMSSQTQLDRVLCIPCTVSKSGWSQTCVHSALPSDTLLYQTYMSRLLLLSSDVELNPGPVHGDNVDYVPMLQNVSFIPPASPSPETQMILMAIASSTDRMSKEISDVKGEVVSIQRDLKGVKHDVANLQKTVQSVEVKCASYDDKFKGVEEAIDRIVYHEDKLQSDIDTLDNRTSRHDDDIETLENKIDRLENELIKNSLRVFGIDEANQENNEQTKTLFSENVLSVAFPIGDFDISNIDNVRRVGKSQADQARMILVKFRSFYDKCKVLEAREVLRTKGIRLSNELTSKQRQILKSKNEQGIKGYFKNGKFCELPASDTGGARIFRHGRRRGDRVVSRAEFRPTVQIGVGQSDMEQDNHVIPDNTNLPANNDS